MSFDENILKQLRDHAVPPPDALFAAISRETVGAVAAQEPSFADKAMAALPELAMMSIAPPAEVTSRIFESIKATSDPAAKVVSGNFGFKAIAVAASVALLFGIGWLAFKNKDKVSDNISTPVATNNNPTPAAPSPPTLDSVASSTGKPAVAIHKPVKREKTYKAFVRPLRDETAEIIVDNEVFVIKNNDLFASFTSLDYNKLPSFLTREVSAPLKVRIDNSTAINISESMLKMLKTSYSTRRSGKLTNKARRMTRKMNKWREADEFYFDKKVQKNPMDPVDLGELLF